VNKCELVYEFTKGLEIVYLTNRGGTPRPPINAHTRVNNMGGLKVGCTLHNVKRWSDLCDTGRAANLRQTRANIEGFVSSRTKRGRISRGDL